MSDHSNEAGLARHYSPAVQRAHHRADWDPQSPNARQDLYRFENGLGASVIYGSPSFYDNYEVCAIEWLNDGLDLGDFNRIDEPFGVDTEEELQQALDQIAGR